MIRIYSMGEMSPEEILARSNPTENVTAAVAGILEAVRNRGDEAVKEYTARFDGVRLENLIVSPEEMEEGIRQV